jgi:hypothetical protein
MSISKIGVALIEHLIGKGFLHGPPACPKCKLPMHLISASGKYIDNCCWICNRTNRKNKRQCRLETNVRYETVFEGSRLTIPELVSEFSPLVSKLLTDIFVIFLAIHFLLLVRWTISYVNQKRDRHSKQQNHIRLV